MGGSPLGEGSPAGGMGAGLPGGTLVVGAAGGILEGGPGDNPEEGLVGSLVGGPAEDSLLVVGGPAEGILPVGIPCKGCSLEASEAWHCSPRLQGMGPG